MEDIRLIGGPSNRSGVVQILYDNAWGGIRTPNRDSRVADVICSQLGHRRGTAYSQAGSEEYKVPYFLRNVHCSGNETSLNECSTKSYSWMYFDSYLAVLCSSEGLI